MGVRRYGIVFNSIAHEWVVELNTRREIPYLQATMYYFVYHINTIALYWQEKPTSLMNENKWTDNPQITIVKCVGANSWNGKMRWIMITKTTMVVIFLPNFHLLTLSLSTEEVFQVNGRNRLVANLPVVDFHPQPKEMPTPKSLNMWVSVFLLLYWFSSSSRKVWTSLSVSDTEFFVFSPP